MVHFVGAGPGAVDLITVRGAELLRRAGVIVYAGSLVNPALLGYAGPDCALYNSAELTLERILDILRAAHHEGREAVRLHTGDPGLYGAVREQADALDRLGIPFDFTPGVPSFCGASAALGREYTLPGGSQTVILTRFAGRTPVPAAEDLSSLARHGAAMVIFLSAAFPDEVQAALLEGAYTPDTPAAVVYKVTWPEERVCHCRLGELAHTIRAAGIRRTALILVGDFLGPAPGRSRLYDPTFSTGFRPGAAP